MDKFRDMHNLSQLTQERIEIMDRSITSEDIGAVIKKTSQQRKAHNEMASLVNSTKYINI